MADSGNQRADAIVAPVCFACHPLSPVPGQLYGTGIGLKRRPRAFKLSLSRVSLRPYIDCNPIPLLSTSSAYPCCDAIACSAPLFYNPVHIQPYPLSQNSQCSSTTRVYMLFGPGSLLCTAMPVCLLDLAFQEQPPEQCIPTSLLYYKNAISTRER